METNDNTTTIENSERVLSVLSGAAMLIHELKKEGTASKIKLGIAGYLIYRGFSGKCALSDKTGINPSIVSGLSHFI
jgi:uncharacterized membrane protein